MNDPKKQNLSSKIIFNDRITYRNDPIKYIIPGEPIAWKRPARNQYNVYDSQKKQKLAFQLTLQSLHESKEFYTGSLALIVYFFTAVPKSSQKHQEFLRNKPYPFTPDIDNYVKFVQDACQGILYENDKTICILSASKKYDYIPRTEFYILELAELVDL